MDLFRRLRRYRFRIRLFVLALLLILIAFSISLFLKPSLETVGILASVALVFVLAFVLLIAVTVSRYKRLCKDNLMKELLEDSYGSVSYREKDGFSEEEIAESGLIMMGNSFESANLVTGERGGVRFEMADVTIGQKTQSGKGYHSVTFFDGCWMTFHLNREFTTTLHIKEKDFSNNQSVSKNRRSLSPVMLEHKDFNRFFRVYAEDEACARYILSSPWIDEIMEIKYALSKDLMIAFSKDTVHVAIHGIKREWDPILPHQVDRRTLKREMLLDISMITDFVDRLAENEALFIPENSMIKSCFETEKNNEYFEGHS